MILAPRRADSATVTGTSAEASEFLGEPRDPQRMAADIHLLADGEIEEYDLQLVAREIEAKLENERRGRRPGGFGRQPPNSGQLDVRRQRPTWPSLLSARRGLMMERKLRKKTTLLCCVFVLGLASACGRGPLDQLGLGEPAIDGSSANAFQRSLEDMVEHMPEEEVKELRSAITVILSNATPAARERWRLLRLTSSCGPREECRSEYQQYIIRQAISGLTAKEIVAEARAIEAAKGRK